jgi:hypothetical protein
VSAWLARGAVAERFGYSGYPGRRAARGGAFRSVVQQSGVTERDDTAVSEVLVAVEIRSGGYGARVAISGDFKEADYHGRSLHPAQTTSPDLPIALDHGARESGSRRLRWQCRDADGADNDQQQRGDILGCLNNRGSGEFFQRGQHDHIRRVSHDRGDDQRGGVERDHLTRGECHLILVIVFLGRERADQVPGSAGSGRYGQGG